MGKNRMYHENSKGKQLEEIFTQASRMLILVIILGICKDRHFISNIVSGDWELTPEKYWGIFLKAWFCNSLI